MVLEPLTRTRIVLTVLVNATVETRLILCLARNILLPVDTGAVFVPLDAETRNYLYIWTRRFVFWTVFGYAVPEAAWWLGAPGAVYALMLNMAGLVVALLAIIFVLQNRAPIARWIAGPSTTASGWGRVRRSLAEIWPVVAILYIAGIYLIYALRIQGGFLYVVRATTLSLAVIVCAPLLVRSIREVSRRGFAIAPDLKAQFPTLEQRANRYLPIGAIPATRRSPSWMAARRRTSKSFWAMWRQPRWRSHGPRWKARQSPSNRRPRPAERRSSAISIGSTRATCRAEPGSAHCCRYCARRSCA